MSDTEYPDHDLGGDRFDDRREDPSSLTRRLMGMGADVMNRALVAGVSAVFMTEEGVRNMVSDLRLPKEVAKGLVSQADATKREIFRIIGREVRTFLEQANVAGSLGRALKDTTVEIRTTIRFRPNEEGGVTPEVRSEVSPSAKLDPEPLEILEDELPDEPAEEALEEGPDDAEEV